MVKALVLAVMAAALPAVAKAQAKAPSGLTALVRVAPDVEVVGKLHPPKTPAPPPVRYYPEAAQRERVEGHATVQCSALMASGVLRDCRVLEDSPAGWGFAQAALNVATLVPHIAKVHGPYELSGVYVVPIHFRMESSAARPAPSSIDAPVWTFVPARAELDRLIDGDKANIEPNAWAFVQCDVWGGSGTLHDCRALTQSAPIPAITRVAVDLAQLLRMDLIDRHREPVGGRNVELWIGFGREPTRPKS
jgi:hypothetical protein